MYIYIYVYNFPKAIKMSADFSKKYMHIYPPKLKVLMALNGYKQ